MNVRFLLIPLTAIILSLHCSDDSGDPLTVQGEGAFRYLRTPDSAFTALPGFDYTPRYATVSPGDLRMHYADEGSPDGRIILLMHGNPAWSALYRNMAPALLDAGYRIIAPDLIGFGRSDKPVSRPAHTYANHVAWITDFITQRALTGITLFCQDWGGLIGLRVAAENSERFAGIIASNTGLPTSTELQDNPAFTVWKAEAQELMNWSQAVENGTTRTLSTVERQIYDIPFPSDEYMAAPRQLPLVVPDSLNDPAIPANQAAWDVYRSWTKPFLTAFGDQDPIFAGFDLRFQQEIPGAAGMHHRTIPDAGHFIQEDAPDTLVSIILEFMNMTEQ